MAVASDDASFYLEEAADVLLGGGDVSRLRLPPVQAPALGRRGCGPSFARGGCASSAAPGPAQPEQQQRSPPRSAGLGSTSSTSSPQRSAPSVAAASSTAASPSWRSMDCRSASGVALTMSRETQASGFAEQGAAVRKVSLADTRTLWEEYQSKATTQEVHLTRSPKWRASRRVASTSGASGGRALGAAEDAIQWADMHEEHAKRKRDLRRFWNEERKSGRGGQSTVHCLQLPTSKPGPRTDIVGQQRRIQTAIRDCSKARRELTEMKRLMADMIPEAGAPEEPEPRTEAHSILPTESVVNLHARFQQYREIATDIGRPFRIKRSMSSTICSLERA